MIDLFLCIFYSRGNSITDFVDPKLSCGNFFLGILILTECKVLVLPEIAMS